jgi:O-antigen/teichoic acid export membrane protein
MFVSAARLGMAILIVRLSGVERYGQYSLILSFLVIAEWLVDFGITDIGVRDISRRPEQEQLLLRAVALLCGAQAVFAYVITVGALLFLGYSAPLVRAGVVGGASLLFYAVAVAFRVLFRVRMRIEHDVIGEAIGTLAMVPLIVLAGGAGAQIDAFMGAYLASRIVQAAVVAYLGRRDILPGTAGVSRLPLKLILGQAVPLGIVGLLVSINDNMVAVVLSKLADIHAVAEYQYATRFVFPIIMIVQSMNVAFFPTLSGTWKSDPKRFSETQQNALEASVIVGAGLFCLINAGAEFLLGIAGNGLQHATLVFRLMSYAVLLQVVTLPVTPLIVVAGGVYKVLWFTALLVVMQFAALVEAVPRYGAPGAAAAYLAIKLVVGTVPIILISQRLTGVRLRWGVPVKTVLCALSALAISQWLFGLGSLWVAVFCALLYCALVLASGTAKWGRVGRILRSMRDTGGRRD